MRPHRFATAFHDLSPARRVGFVRQVSAGRIEADGPACSVGDICTIGQGARQCLAEVVAVGESRTVLAPLDAAIAISPDDRVEASALCANAPVGEAFAGRAVDAMGVAIDASGPLHPETSAPLQGVVLAPLDRAAPNDILVTGVRAIDALLTLARGQRIGVFSASGVGKTTLISQLLTQTDIARCIVCLVGERGREVEMLWRGVEARPDRERFTCVAATSDRSAPLRARAVHQALALGEYWRARGDHVLLIVDSVTRYAMALREIGLAAGAPPTLRAYTPDVFAALPRLVERCGAQKAGGSLTAIMTVLSETDDVDDPIVEVMKSLLDGHIVLSRRLAEQGHYPAIDVLRSVSQLSETLMSPAHASAARTARAHLSAYEEARPLIETGLYKPGADKRIDAAIHLRQAANAFLRQEGTQKSSLADSLTRLRQCFGQEPSLA